ncbi:MAG: glycosyltransferase family 2 protein [Eubacteriales bacterium]|nr:glycosyltransferase family 2 protein [Eubacteriales bacterium]
MKEAFNNHCRKDIVAVVVTYNRMKLLEKCVESLQGQSVVPDIMIIDNASTDGTAELFRNSKKNVHYYNTGSNLGGAGGFSYGIEKAVEKGYKYIWILDDDTMPTETALEAFVQKDNELKGKYGFLSSKVLWKDESICTMNIQKITKWKQLKEYDKCEKIQYASFVSLFVKAETVKSVGLPYKDFFIWADDWEYTRRISKTCESYFLPESVVNHWCASNIGADIVTVSEDRLNRFEYMYRNDVVMYRQDGIEGYFYLLIRNFLHVFRILTKSSAKLSKIKLMLKATLKGFRFKPQIVYPKEK